MTGLKRISFGKQAYQFHWTDEGVIGLEEDVSIRILIE